MSWEKVKLGDLVKISKGEMKRTAFFPGGRGLFDQDDSISNRKIMVLGQDFDCEANFHKSIQQEEGDITKNPTWRNIFKLFDDVRINKLDWLLYK